MKHIQPLPQMMVVSACLALALVTLSTSTEALAGGATPNWQGDDVTSPSDYGTAENWDLGFVPGMDEYITFPDTASTFVVDLGGDRTVNGVTFSGATGYTINSNTIEVTNLAGIDVLAAAVTHTINSNVVISDNVPHDWSIGGGATLVVNGILSDGANIPSLIKSDTGTLTLTGANTYSGGTVIKRGEISISSDANLGDSGSGVEIFTGAGLFVTASHTTSRDITVTKQSGLSAAQFRIDSGQVYTIDGVIDGNVGPTFRGPGTVVLNGNNTFNASQSFGSMSLTSGVTVEVSNDANLGDPSVNLEFSGSGPTLHVTATHSTNRSFRFYFSNENISVATDENYTINGNIAAPNSSGFNKIGGGSLTLTNANNFNGGVRVNAGTLLANNTTGSATGSGTVTVNDGATLAGIGSIAGGVTANSGSTVAPGASLGILTVGGLTLNGGSMFAVGLIGDGGVAGTDFDLLDVTGNASLGGSLSIELFNAFLPDASDTFTVLNANTLSGAFENVADGGRLLVEGGEGSFLVSYDGTTNAVLLSDFIAGPILLEGDLNGDGFVGIADLNIVLGLWNQNVTPGDLLQGDPSGDGFVGISDLNVVLGNWNAGTPPSEIVATPEPTSLTLLGLGGLILAKQRGRR
ncbi:MAG: autotransporter-associated beta strand repeat-containing protein [Phycisphaerales bacterium]